MMRPLKPRGTQKLKISREMLFPESFTDSMIKRARRAANGDVEAQLEMAEMYRLGNGVPSNSEEAAVWYRRAFGGGSVEARYRLGKLLLSRGMDAEMAGENTGKAVELLTQAATAGHRAAMVSLGNLHARGTAVPKDLSMAAHWYEKAACLGDASSQFVYGMMLRDGKGTGTDPLAAFVWISRALRNGLPAKSRKAALAARKVAQDAMTPEERLQAQTAAAAPDHVPVRAESANDARTAASDVGSAA